MPMSEPTPLHIRAVTHDMLRYTLDSVYGRASTYAARLATMDLDEGERRALLDQHRKADVERALADLEDALGGWTIIRDPAEGQCP